MREIERERGRERIKSYEDRETSETGGYRENARETDREIDCS